MEKVMNVGSQFHALPEELLEFVLKQVAEFSLHAAVLRQFPSEVVRIDTGGIPGAFADPTAYTLVLTVNPPVLPADGLLDLCDKNPDSLRIDIGRRTEKGLGESWIRTRASDRDAVKIWKKIIGRFKRMTHAGATVVNPNTGATGHARDHRYTDGAKALEQEGVTILQVGGSLTYRLG